MPMPLNVSMDRVSLLTTAHDSYRGLSDLYAKNAALSEVDGEVAHDAPLQSHGAQGIAISKETVNFDWVAEIARNEAGQASWYHKKINEALSEFVSKFGTKDSQGTIAHICQTFVDRFNALSNSTDPNVKYQAISDFQYALQKFKDLQIGITEQRKRIVSNEEQIVSRANELIKEIARNNYPMRTAEQETALVKNINELSQLIDTQVQFESDSVHGGVAKIFIGNQVKLVDGVTIMGTLRYNAVSAIGPGQNIGTIEVVTNQGPMDIRPFLTGGQLAGYTAADRKLVNINSVLDQFAIKFTNTLNEIHNAGTSGTATPTVLSGSTGCFGAEGVALTGAETISGSGLWRLAITDVNGKMVDYVDINLSTVTTVNDLITAANTGNLRIAGTANNLFTIGFNSTGGLRITCNDQVNHRIAVGSAQDSSGILQPDKLCLGNTFNAANAVNVSHFFHLNDLISRTSVVPGNTNGIFGNIQINSTIANSPELLAGSILKQNYTITNTEYAIPTYSRENFDLLYQSLVEVDVDFPNVGEFSAVKTNLRDYALGISSYYVNSKKISDQNTQAAENEYQRLILEAGKKSGKTTPEEEFKKLTELDRRIRAIEACLAQSMRMEERTQRVLLEDVR